MHIPYTRWNRPSYTIHVKPSQKPSKFKDDNERKTHLRRYNWNAAYELVITKIMKSKNDCSRMMCMYKKILVGKVKIEYQDWIMLLFEKKMTWPSFVQTRNVFFFSFLIPSDIKAVYNNTWALKSLYIYRVVCKS